MSKKDEGTGSSCPVDGSAFNCIVTRHSVAEVILRYSGTGWPEGELLISESNAFRKGQNPSTRNEANAKIMSGAFHAKDFCLKRI